MNEKADGTKFRLMHTILGSTLNAQDKTLLISLVLHYNESYGLAWPSVERLCQARGITHEKNFAGVQKYLPDLAYVTKRGRRGNAYTLNFPAIEALPQHTVRLKHTPFPMPNADTPDPALPENAPAPEAPIPSVADPAPCAAGANTKRDTKEDSSREETRSRTAKRGQGKNSSISCPPSAASGPPSAATEASGSLPLPLAPELPAPGGMNMEQPRLSLDVENDEGAQSSDRAREALTEAHRAARVRVLDIERAVRRRVHGEDRQRLIAARVQALDDDGSDARIDSLIDAAIENGDPW